MQDKSNHRKQTTDEYKHRILESFQAELVDLTNFSASRSPFRKSTLREYSFSNSGAGLLLELKGTKMKAKSYQHFLLFYFSNRFFLKPHMVLQRSRNSLRLGIHLQPCANHLYQVREGSGHRYFHREAHTAVVFVGYG